MTGTVILSGIKSSQTFSQTNNQNNENPISLPDLDSGQVTSATGNTSSNIKTGGIVGDNAGGTINMLDGGSIAKAFDFASSSVTELLDFTAKVFDKNQTQVTAASNFAGQQAQAAIAKATEQTNSNADLIKNLLIAVGVLGGLYIAGKFWGKK